MRNEMLRLPQFLDHYRRLGVDHFLVALHDSQDGSADLLTQAKDVSVWAATGSYRQSRFGMDWLNALLLGHGHGHWCVTVDADELLIYPHWDRADLHVLTGHLQDLGRQAMGAMMLDLYPKGPLDQPDLAPGDDPMARLDWFDPGPYRQVRQYPKQNLWLQGGARERAFFADRPRRAPTLNKLPLMRWNRRFAYANSTHSALPRRLNLAYDGPGDPRLSGVLLHTKLLPDIIARSTEEKARRQHFGQAAEFDSYYDALIAAPDLWHPGAVQLQGWQQLAELGLMSDEGWRPAATDRPQPAA